MSFYIYNDTQQYNDGDDKKELGLVYNIKQAVDEDNILGLTYNLAWSLYLTIVEFLNDEDLKNCKIRVYRKNHNSLVLDSNHELIIDVNNIDSGSYTPLFPGPGNYLIQVWHSLFHVKEFIININTIDDLISGLKVELRRMSVHKMNLL